MDTRELVLKLHEIGAIKFGAFQLKSGRQSPIYIDLRLIISYPGLLELIANQLWKLAEGLSFDLLCGVPYTALPIATALSLQQNIPMCMRRKEVKAHGTKRAIEGAFDRGNRVLIVEDLITSGASVMETVSALREEGLIAEDAVMLIDREQGGACNLREQGVRAHSLCTLRQVVKICKEAGRISEEMSAQIDRYLKQNASVSLPEERELTYGERASLCRNPVARDLLTIMEEKQTNLSFNPDVSDKEKLLSLVDLLGPEICLLKTHIDLVEDFDAQLTGELQALANKHRFLIFEDRKFADIGSVVKGQYRGGMYRIADWAHITNAHMVPGPGIVNGLKAVGLPKGRGLMLLAEMSTEGSLATGAYTDKTLSVAAEHRDFVIGFVAGRRLTSDPGWIHLTPGVQLQAGSDDLMQQFRTPDRLIRELKTDIIQVGRGIYQADEPLKAARQYRAAGWEAYQRRLGRAA